MALALLSAVALALTTTLVATQRARAVSEQWMQAALLAAEGVEQLRAGQAPGPVRAAGGVDRSATVVPWNGHPGLWRLEVAVTWNDGEPRRFQLVTLARR